MKFLPIVILAFWLLTGLYMGIGGLTRAKLDDTLLNLEQDKEKLVKDTVNIIYDGLDFSIQYELQYYREAESVEKIFPWALKISSFFILIMTALSFGLLGGVVSIIKEIVFDRKPLNDLQIWSLPILGLLTGFIVLGMSYLLPTVLVKNGGDIRPVTLMFLCLFGGMFARSLFEKLTAYFNKMFLS